MSGYEIDGRKIVVKFDEKQNDGYGGHSQSYGNQGMRGGRGRGNYQQRGSYGRY